MSEKWKVGDRVQTEIHDTVRTEDITVRVGSITSVVFGEEQRNRFNYNARPSREESYTVTVIKEITIKWDNGEDETRSPWSVHKQDSEFELAFRLASSVAQKRIDEKLAMAHAALREAVKISNETGIPFNASISPLSQSYIPVSLAEKFSDLDRDFINEITDSYGEYDGWQHSAVC